MNMMTFNYMLLVWLVINKYACVQAWMRQVKKTKKKQALAYSLLQAVISTFTKTNVYICKSYGFFFFKLGKVMFLKE